MPSKMETPPTLGQRAGLRKSVHAASLNKSGDTADPRQPSSIVAEREQLIDTLQIVADWLDDWRARSERAQLCLELVGVSRERQDELIREGNALLRCMSALERSTAESEAA